MDEEFDLSHLAARNHPVDACIPVFHYRPMLDSEASEALGKNVYKDMVFVEIIVPGNAKERVIRPVEDRDKARWPAQWKKFEEYGAGHTDIDGTPVEEWPQATPGQVKTLRAADIMTVEQFAEVADSAIYDLGMGMMDLRSKAQVYVGFKNDEIKVQKVMAENRKLKKLIKHLENQTSEMQSRLEEFERAKDPASDRAGGSN